MRVAPGASPVSLGECGIDHLPSGGSSHDLRLWREYGKARGRFGGPQGDRSAAEYRCSAGCARRRSFPDPPVRG